MADREDVLWIDGRMSVDTGYSFLRRTSLGLSTNEAPFSWYVSMFSTIFLYVSIRQIGLVLKKILPVAV